MVRKIKQQNPLTFRVLSILGKLFIFALRVIVALAPDERRQVRYTPEKAKQLYEDGVITGSEYAKHVNGDS